MDEGQQQSDIPIVTIEEFGRLKLVTATVVEAAPHPNADRLTVLTIDVGNGRRKQIVAGIRAHYPAEALAGKTIIVVDNLQPTTLRGVRSEGMLLAVRLPNGDLSLLTTDKGAPPGLAVS